GSVFLCPPGRKFYLSINQATAGEAVAFQVAPGEVERTRTRREPFARSAGRSSVVVGGDLQGAASAGFVSAWGPNDWLSSSSAQNLDSRLDHWRPVHAANQIARCGSRLGDSRAHDRRAAIGPDS